MTSWRTPGILAMATALACSSGCGAPFGQPASDICSGKLLSATNDPSENARVIQRAMLSRPQPSCITDVIAGQNDATLLALRDELGRGDSVYLRLDYVQALAARARRGHQLPRQLDYAELEAFCADPPGEEGRCASYLQTIGSMGSESLIFR